MNRAPFIALDFPTWEITSTFLDQFSESLNVKVGMELYLQNGPEIIEKILNKHHRIFLDLKLHDIPNTVYGAMKGLAGFDLELINVHAAGGSKMMEKALEGLYAGTPANHKRPNLIAVTQLTSTTEDQMRKEQLIPTTINESVLHYATLAKHAGLDGVVCSPHEARLIKEHCGNDFLRVTPGIRLAEDHLADQKRVTTPQMAKEMGSSYIVVGRSITGAVNPVLAYERIVHEWEGKE
ncbi:orotidine-5'-phosphate decarboxylase [Rossellomorea vietnamensis]|uniref:Orotidine 5'-phosphate decarboxylase n=1 Tax=Rossellomorea vietnamensis TaxID=218284 RepID=A0A0P6WI77_9BACI|nr:orotidine-5'-phosphate decarboxylase [Rossellomorea vietnamensis]KPL61190.1 orotidine 5'-phosphate decarboxylase [Rossellomorea vietnamensis]